MKQTYGVTKKFSVICRQIIAWFVRDFCYKYHSSFAENFTYQSVRKIESDNFRISLVVFIPF